LELFFEPTGEVVYVEPRSHATLIAGHGPVKYDVFHTEPNVLELYPTPHTDAYVDGEFVGNFLSCRYGEGAALFELTNRSDAPSVWVFEPGDVRIGLPPGSCFVVRCVPQIARLELARRPCGEWYVWVSHDHEVWVDDALVYRGSSSALTHRDVS
jgi:hypothetical protein